MKFLVRKIWLTIFFVGFVITSSGSSMLAWWEKGHEIVVENAALKLPENMPHFIKDQIAALRYLSLQPDQWKTYGNELKRSEEPNHYIDLEKLTNNPLRLGFEEDRYAAIHSYSRMKETPRSVGLLPYQLIEYYQRLKGAFYRLRKDPTNAIIQNEIIHYAGLLSHYAGDLAQPLHTTIHYDGRVDKGGHVVRNKGIHAKFEGTFVDNFITGKDCLPFIQAPVVYVDIYAAIREAIKLSFGQVDEVYKLDDAHKLDTPDAATKVFVQKRLAHGSQFLLNLWYTAWNESEKP